MNYLRIMLCKTKDHLYRVIRTLDDFDQFESKIASDKAKEFGVDPVDLLLEIQNKFTVNYFVMNMNEKNVLDFVNNMKHEHAGYKIVKEIYRTCVNFGKIDLFVEILKNIYIHHWKHNLLKKLRKIPVKALEQIVDKNDAVSWYIYLLSNKNMFDYLMESLDLTANCKLILKQAFSKEKKHTPNKENTTLDDSILRDAFKVDSYGQSILINALENTSDEEIELHKKILVEIADNVFGIYNFRIMNATYYLQNYRNIQCEGTPKGVIITE